MSETLSQPADWPVCLAPGNGGGRGMYGCYFFNERRASEGALILGIGPTTFAMFELRKVHDVFGIGLEIVRVIIPLLICAGKSHHNDGLANVLATVMWLWWRARQNRPDQPNCSHRMATTDDHPPYAPVAQGYPRMLL